MFQIHGGGLSRNYLDNFFVDHADARAARAASFIVMKVNMSPQNENHAFLGRFPKIPAYPYLLVLDAEGKMLTGQKTSDLEECCKTYSGTKMKEFLSSWKAQ